MEIKFYSIEEINKIKCDFQVFIFTPIIVNVVNLVIMQILNIVCIKN
jgi:hypothetical protein